MAKKGASGDGSGNIGFRVVAIAGINWLNLAVLPFPFLLRARKARRKLFEAWGHALLDPFVLMVMFFFMVIATIITLRAQDIL